MYFVSEPANTTYNLSRRSNKLTHKSTGYAGNIVQKALMSLDYATAPRLNEKLANVQTKTANGCKHDSAKI